jgi:hypothetical protein
VIDGRTEPHKCLSIGKLLVVPFSTAVQRYNLRRWIVLNQVNADCIELATLCTEIILGGLNELWSFEAIELRYLRALSRSARS